MAEQKKTPVTIDDKQYFFEDMTDEQKLSSITLRT